MLLDLQASFLKQSLTRDGQGWCFQAGVLSRDSALSCREAFFVLFCRETLASWGLWPGLPTFKRGWREALLRAREGGVHTGFGFLPVRWAPDRMRGSVTDPGEGLLEIGGGGGLPSITTEKCLSSLCCWSSVLYKRALGSEIRRRKGSHCY